MTLSFANLSMACDLSLESNSRIRYEEYSSQDRKLYRQKIQIRVRNSSKDKCVGVLGVKAVGTRQYLHAGQSQGLAFKVFGSSNTPQLLFKSNSNIQNTVPMSLDAQASATLELFLVIDRFQNSLSGTYFSDLEIRLGSNKMDLINSLPLRVGAVIKPNIQANITGLNATAVHETASFRNRHSLKLGELIPKKSYKLGLQIRSNLPVIISLGSKNRGYLRHEIEGAELPYSIELNGQSLQLRQTTRIPGRSSLYKDGRTNPIDIRLGDFGNNLPSGKYSDIITFHISAR